MNENVKLFPKKLYKNAISDYIKKLIDEDQIIHNLEKGLLLDISFDRNLNKIYCKFYDLDSDTIKYWIDNKKYESYCLTKTPIKELKKFRYEKNGRKILLTRFWGFKRFETIKKYDLLLDKEVKLTKIYVLHPSNIKIKNIYKTSIYSILKENDSRLVEKDINHYENFVFDKQLVPGLIYTIKNGKIEKNNDDKFIDKTVDFSKFFKNEVSEMKDFANGSLNIFRTKVPIVKCLALDIETTMGKVIDSKKAKEIVISVGFVSNDGLKVVYVLKRDNISFDKMHKDFPQDANIEIFESEKDLLLETFKLIEKYPIIVTFNGNNFDLTYLYHRALNFKINRDYIPITSGRGYGLMVDSECDLRKGVHIDLFNLFFNKALRAYAFAGKYNKCSLDTISEALLGEKKIEHEEKIHDMSGGDLIWYNLKDAMLTLELLFYNNSLVWNLLIMLCRISKMPIRKLIVRQVSGWIKNLFYFEHRRKNYLIPSHHDISVLKSGGLRMSKTNASKYLGAFVIKPIPGIHFNAVVMDFSSLYPTIIKRYNLSYETLICPHEEDKDNFFSGTPYYICSKKMGITAYVVGFLRDIRIEFFKPKSNDKSLTEDQRSYYETIQQSIKVFMNASYGVIGSRVFPLYCSPVAESTTSIGQYSIKETIKKAESLGVKVLYGDTDSIFLDNPSEERIKELEEWSKRELDLELEAEKTYQFLALSDRKKNYVGILKDTKKIDLKGVTAKKKHTPEFIKKIFNEVLELLKNVTNKEEFIISRKKIISFIQKNLYKVEMILGFDLKDYAVHITLQKEIENYIKTIPQHVRAAKDHQNITKKKYIKGEIVSFIKTKSGAKVLELAKFSDVDSKKYVDLLKSALEQLLDALGISFDEIKGQLSLERFVK